MNVIVPLRVISSATFILMLLVSSDGQALLLNTYADYTVTDPQNVTTVTQDNQTASNGIIQSNVPTEDGKAAASSKYNKFLYASAGSSGWYTNYYEQYHARAEWIGTTGGGTTYFHIFPGFLSLGYGPDSIAQYSIEVWNNNNLIWDSSASAQMVGGSLVFTKSGVDFGGTVYDDGFSTFSYDFTDVHDHAHAAAGTLEYIMDVVTSNGGHANIGDPFNLTGGFEEVSFTADTVTSSVPEPSTYLLLVTGLLCIAGLRSRILAPV